MNTTNEADSDAGAGPVERTVGHTAGMRAYAAWHGMTLEHVRDEWDSVPKADKMRAKWEAVGAAVEAAERERCAGLADDFANRAWNDARSEAWSDEFELLARNIREA